VVSRMLGAVTVVLCVAAGGSLAGCSQPTPSPVTDLSTVGMPASPITDKTVECLIDRGWDAKRNLEGGWDGPENLPAAQQPVYFDDVQECGDETGWNTAWQNLTEAQMKELYVQEVREYQCIVDQGYGGTEPPTEQTYLDTFHSADQYYAIMSAQDLGRARYEALISVCPPPTWFLNISGLN
jgi:hypothetical protein